MPISDPYRSRMLDKLGQLYGQQASEVLGRIDDLVDRYADLRRPEPDSLWDQRSVVLITYGDQVQSGNHQLASYIACRGYSKEALVNII